MILVEGSMKKTQFKGLDAIQLENEFLSLTFLPDYACKMVSLLKKDTVREFLFQAKEETLTPPPYAAAFSAYDSSGFDEVFPSIDACPYPCGSYQGTPIPDHGEVWAMKWQHFIHPDGCGLTAWVESEHLPYKFIRTLSLQGKEVHIHYTVENLSEEPFEFIWTPHCLLNCSPHTVLLTPENLSEVVTVEHSTKNLGPWGTRHSYPLTISTNGENIDLSATQPVEDKSCEKFYFTAPNTRGWCGIYHADNGDTLTYHYDADKVPYLGVWKTQGGYRGDYNIALEPCTGIYDDLYVAHKIRRSAVCAPKSKFEWKFIMKAGQELL